MHTHVFTTEVFDPVSLSLGYNDAVSFAIKSDFLFLEGIELEIKQDKINMKYPNSIAYTLYTDIKPEPSKKISIIQGKNSAQRCCRTNFCMLLEFR